MPTTINVFPSSGAISVVPEPTNVQIYGPAGPQGPKGDPGAGLLIKGTISTSANLPVTGNTYGDLWIAQDTGHAWVWEAPGQWSDVGKIQGATGPTGPQGATGPPGTPGATGPQGSQGPIGATGPQGSTGSSGPQGVQGPKGDTGATGPAGAQGLPGASGPQGPQGQTGAAGSQGPQGLTGATGAQGPPGAASTVPGPSGATGATGPQGQQGLQGASGNPGPRGDAGPPGAQGLQGIPGSAGPQGSPGAQGPPGPLPQTDWIQWDPAFGWPAPGYGNWLSLVASPWWASTGDLSYVGVGQRQADGTTKQLGLYNCRGVDLVGNRLLLFNTGYGFSGTYTPV